jgi:hypothetical protein
MHVIAVFSIFAGQHVFCERRCGNLRTNPLLG